MDLNTVLTHGLTYLAALALPLWLLGEQIAAWLVLRKKDDAVKTEVAEIKPKRPVVVPLEEAA